MASFRLGRFFSQPEILRGIDPENLLSLLVDHAPALQALGYVLPAADAATQSFMLIKGLKSRHRDILVGGRGITLKMYGSWFLFLIVVLHVTPRRDFPINHFVLSK